MLASSLRQPGLRRAISNSKCRVLPLGITSHWLNNTKNVATDSKTTSKPKTGILLLNMGKILPKYLLVY